MTTQSWRLSARLHGVCINAEVRNPDQLYICVALVAYINCRTAASMKSICILCFDRKVDGTAYTNGASNCAR
jgi:hypothetical protein